MIWPISILRTARRVAAAVSVLGVLLSPAGLLVVGVLLVVVVMGGGGYSNAIKQTAADCAEIPTAPAASSPNSIGSPAAAATSASATTSSTGGRLSTSPRPSVMPYSLPAASGTTGLEETVNAQGQVPSSGGAVTWAHFAALGSDYQNYYLTMRWNYASWNFNGTTGGPIDQAQYAWFDKGHDGKPWIVTVTNPRTHQSVNLAAIEAGPAPWVGVADSHHSSNADAADYGWTNPTKGTPAGWKGIVAGMPEAALTSLGAVTGYPGNNGDILYYAWGVDQNAPPGPTGDTAAQLPGNDTPVQNCTAVVATDCGNLSTGEVPDPMRSEMIAAGRGHNVPPAVLAALYLTEQNGFTFEYRWYDTGQSPGAFQLSATDPAWKLSTYGTAGEWPAGGTFRGPFQFGPIWESTYQTSAHPDVLNFADAAYGVAAYLADLGAKNNPNPDQIRTAAESYNGQTSFTIGNGIRNPDPGRFTTVRQLYADQVVNLVQALTGSFTTAAATTAATPTTSAPDTPAGTGAPTSSVNTACQPGNGAIAVNGAQITLPSNANVTAAAAGQTITAPSAAVARGLAAGFAAVGLPYVYGGGTNGGPPDEGCARAGGAENSCQGIIGFDCSGLTAYVLAHAGFHIPDNSGAQRTGGTGVPWSQGQPGDIIGYNGHVAIYLGRIHGVPYLLEAPDVGMYVHIRPVYYSNGGVPVDTVLHRYWAP